MSLFIWRYSFLIASACCLPYLFLTKALFLWTTYGSGGWLGLIVLGFLTSPGYIVFGGDIYAFYVSVATQYLGSSDFVRAQVVIGLNVILIFACTFLPSLIVARLTPDSERKGQPQSH